MRESGIGEGEKTAIYVKEKKKKKFENNQTSRKEEKLDAQEGNGQFPLSPKEICLARVKTIETFSKRRLGR